MVAISKLQYIPSKYLSADDNLMEWARIYENDMGKWLTFDTKYRK